MSRLNLYLEKSAASTRATVRASGKPAVGGKKAIPNNLLTLALALPAGYGMYRALDDILKKHREH